VPIIYGRLILVLSPPAPISPFGLLLVPKPYIGALFLIGYISKSCSPGPGIFIFKSSLPIYILFSVPILADGPFNKAFKLFSAK